MERMSRQQLFDFREAIRARLLIDQYNLDDECIKQPAFYAEVCNELPEYKAEYRRAKARFERAQADLEGEIRQDPGAYGLVKPTRDAVEACIIRQDSYGTAQEEVIEAEYFSNSIEQLLHQVEQRKSMIRDLVVLFEKNYRQQMSQMPMTKDSAALGESRAEEIGNEAAPRTRGRTRDKE